jgi:hypothetical protein
MNLQTIRGKKSQKLLFLLFTSLLIGVVSAQVYSYMYIQGSGTITTGGLAWQLGSTAPGGTSIQGYTVKNLNLTIQKNNFKNFTDCLRLINNDATSHTFSLASAVTAGNTTKFTTFNLAVYQSGGARITKISIKNQQSASSLTIQGSETLYIRFEVDPLTDETSGYMAFTVTLTYD